MARRRELSVAEKFKELTSRWTPFPNTNPADGEYDYFSQTIRLNAIDLATMEAARRGDFAARLKLFPLLAHEMQHLADHTSSLWGRDLLVRLFDVYAVRWGGNLDEFGRILTLMRELKTVHYTDYYTEFSDLAFEPWDGQRWLYQFTTGVQLDASGRGQEDRPIVFTRFARQRDGAALCRVPFSVASLLEVRAVAAEMITALALFEKAGGDPVRLIDRKNWAEGMSAMFYSAPLALYSVAAHCFANTLRTQEGTETYTKASAVAWFCLNLPRRFFPELKIPDAFGNWGPRNQALRANADRGYLYLALLEHGRGVGTNDMETWLEGSLARAGLPPLVKVLPVIDEERVAAAATVTGSPYQQRLDDLLRLGLEYASGEGMTPAKTHVFGAGSIPPFLTGDGQFVCYDGSPTPGTFNTPHEWFSQAFKLYNGLREFVDACIM